MTCPEDSGHFMERARVRCGALLSHAPNRDRLTAVKSEATRTNNQRSAGVAATPKKTGTRHSSTPTRSRHNGGYGVTAHRTARIDSRNDDIVAMIAVGSYPQCAMQLAQRGSRPRPYASQSVSSTSSR